MDGKDKLGPDLNEKLKANSTGLRRLKSCSRMVFLSICGTFMCHMLRAVSPNLSPRYALKCFEFISTHIYPL